MSSATQTRLGDYTLPEADPYRGFSATARFRLFVKARASARGWYWDEYDRSDYECPTCGVHASETAMHVHHRDGDPLNNHPLNLIAVCAWCHRLEHRTRRTTRRLEQWKDKYADIFQEEP